MKCMHMFQKGFRSYFLREDINTFSFGHRPNEGGGVYPCPDFLAPNVFF